MGKMGVSIILSTPEGFHRIHWCGRIRVFAVKVNTSYPSNWFTLDLHTVSDPLSLYCDNV